MKSIAIYSRKSCVTDTGESIQNQISICKEYIYTHICTPESCNLTIYRDEGFSAKNTDRPEFQKMIKNAESGLFSYIVCYKLDRISRNIGDFSKLIEKLGKMNISFICVKEQFDTSVPIGRAMMYMASVFAQLERETIAERVKDNMMMLSKYGQWLGGTTPLGFKSYKTDKNTSEPHSKYKFYLKTIGEEITVVKKIFNKFLKCRSLTTTTQHLNQLNLKSRNGNAFSIPAIKKILANPVYCCADKDARNYFEKLGAEVCFGAEECNPSLGITAYNKRNYRQNNGKKNPICSWIIALGSHRGIIKGKHWVRVNKVLNSKISINTKSSLLLYKKIICKTCNSKMLAKKRNNGQNFDYICASKIYNCAKKCSCHNLDGKYADKFVALQTIMVGLKGNRFLMQKLSILKNSISKRIITTNSPKININICEITKNICGNAATHFVDKAIDSVFWDNINLTIKLKNCN